jgi:type VI secretion system secreted protein Hcp
MAVDYFLKLDGVDGESTDDKHKGEIEIDSFSWGATNTGTAGMGGGSGSGKVAQGDFSFIKKFDKCSPTLFIGCATGQHFKKATLTCRKAGGGQQEYLKLNFEGVLISSYQMVGNSENVIPRDQFSVNFAALEVSYKPQQADGTLGGEVKQKYDFAANKKV